MKFIKFQLNKLILNNVKLFKWQSIFVKYVAIIAGFLIIPSTILFLLYNYNVSKSSFLSNSKLALNYFDNTVQSCDSIYTTLYDSNNFKSYFFTDDEKTTAENIDNIYNILSNAGITNPYYDSVYIYDKQRDYILTLNGSAYYDRFHDIECFENYDVDSSIVYRNIDRISNTYPVLTFYHRIMYEGVDCGIIAININAKLLSDLLFKNDITVDFTDSNGNIVFSSNTENIGKVNNSSDSYKKDSLKIRNFNNVYSNSLNSCNLYMVAAAPVLEFASPFQIFGLILLIILCCIVVAFTITMQYYTAISKILSITSDPYDTNENHKNERTNELTIIANNISNLQRENKNMELDLAKQISLLKNSQMVALYTQINPHFIFNTLQIISLLALKDAKEDTELTKIINKFSNMLRCTLDTKTYFVSVDEEIKITENFVDIINLRYKNKFSIIYEIDENVRKQTILKFSLQPIIENAIKHAFPKKTDKDCIIKIKIHKEKENLAICVEDNGIGIEKTILDELNYSMRYSDTIAESSGIGISNINMRYKIIYGNEYGCYINSQPGIGTTVKIKLPCES